MSWLRHYLESFKAKPLSGNDEWNVDCRHRLRYDDGLILCYYMGVRSIESCKDCEYKE